MTMTLNEAAKSCKKAKGTILKAIRDGRLSAPRDEDGRYKIDPSELHRVFKTATTDQSTSTHITPTTEQENRLEIERLRAELKAANNMTETMAETVVDLRRRLDQEGEERRQMMAILTDQRLQKQEKRGFFSFFKSV